jgi:hypothetical protein
MYKHHKIEGKGNILFVKVCKALCSVCFQMITALGTLLSVKGKYNDKP